MAAATGRDVFIYSMSESYDGADSVTANQSKCPSFSEVIQDNWVKVNITESFKVVVLGDSQVGKTSLAHLFIKAQPLVNSMTTIGFEPFKKQVKTGDRAVKLILWDTAGQERFRSNGGLVSMFYRGADAAVFVYDVTNADSLTSVNHWYREMEMHCSARDLTLALVGNKTDLGEERTVPREQAELFAENKNMLYREVSSNSKESYPYVKELFIEVAERLIAAKERDMAIRSTPQRSVQLGEESGGWIILNHTDVPEHVPRERSSKRTKC